MVLIRRENNSRDAEYIQFGCGLSCPDGWMNFDVSPRLRFERLPIFGAAMRFSGNSLFPNGVLFGDIVKGLPLNPANAKAVYCSHVLEHLDRVSVTKALNNTFSLLRPGGVFRLVVPDLAWRARLFLDGHKQRNSEAADQFMNNSYLGVEVPVTGAVSRLRQVFGNAAHRWMYDHYAMEKLLSEAGFVGTRRCAFGDAEDPMFSLVEEEGRFHDRGNEELAIEARRPLG